MRWRSVIVTMAVRGAVLPAMVALALAAPLATAVHPAAAAVARPATTASVVHVVRSGDSLFGIAQRYGVSLDSILKANKLRSSSIITPGQRLTIPGIVLPTKLPPRLPDDIRSYPARLRLLPVFQAQAARYNVPADLLMAVAYTESGWRADVVSAVGAVGIGQLMPATSAWVASELIGLPKLDPRVPEDNIRMSARFLRYLLDRYPGSTRLALAAYFEGSGTVTDNAGPSRGAQRYARLVLQRRPLFTF